MSRILAITMWTRAATLTQNGHCPTRQERSLAATQKDWITAVGGGFLLAVGFAARIANESARPLHGAGLLGRVLGCALLLYWAGWVRRSLTPLLLAAMGVGIELGLDAPGLAVSSHFVSDIFLRLVKTIVAPLILVTLISGIAGHGDLKSVGRMG